ncbi:MAG: AraC family transcriptional regulator, partial [Firmicutes bacterium]|nr:AraC family transcriptional regulator [Bacillota bacterium]
MSHAAKGDAGITVHTHVNIVAVAVLAELVCIIIPESIEVDDGTV